MLNNKNISKVLTSLTTLALGIPGIAHGEAEKNQPKNGEVDKNFDSSGKEVRTDLKYTHYTEAGTRYKVDIWQGFLVVPYKNWEFSLNLQKDVQSGASSFTMQPASLLGMGPTSSFADSRTNASISDNRDQVSLTGTYA